jgi:hypothetical protein
MAFRTFRGWLAAAAHRDARIMLILLAVAIVFEISVFLVLLPHGVMTAIQGAIAGGAIGIAIAGALLVVWDRFAGEKSATVNSVEPGTAAVEKSRFADPEPKATKEEVQNPPNINLGWFRSVRYRPAYRHRFLLQ